MQTEGVPPQGTRKDLKINSKLLTHEWQTAHGHLILRLLHMHPQNSPQHSREACLKHYLPQHAMNLYPSDNYPNKMQKAKM